MGALVRSLTASAVGEMVGSWSSLQTAGLTLDRLGRYWRDGGGLALLRSVVSRFRLGRIPTTSFKRLLLMHDARTLLDLGEEAVRRLARRGYTLDLARLEDLFSRRNSLIKSGDDLRAESKQVAAEVGKTAKAGGP